jgi:vacuolar-type H+-ATPase subunit I/STV1
MNSRNLVAVVVTMLVVIAADVSRGAEFESRFAQRAERNYMDELEDAAEAYKRSLEDAKESVMRDGNLAEANRIDAEIKKMKREIKLLEQWPKLEKTTYDFRLGGWPEGKFVRRDFWSDGRVFTTDDYNKAKTISESGDGWRSYVENGQEKIQVFPSTGKFLNTFSVEEGGDSAGGTNHLGDKTFLRRVGRPSFELRKPVR